MKREILLIDDDHICNMITQLLMSSKFSETSIQLFSNGQEALEYLQSYPATPYLVMLDLNMPVMNGWEFLKEVRNLQLRTPLDLEIYIVSSSVDNEDLARASADPLVMDYFIKPLKLQDLDFLSVGFQSNF